MRAYAFLNECPCRCNHQKKTKQSGACLGGGRVWSTFKLKHLRKEADAVQQRDAAFCSVSCVCVLMALAVPIGFLKAWLSGSGVPQRLGFPDSSRLDQPNWIKLDAD